MTKDLAKSVKRKSPIEFLPYEEETPLFHSQRGHAHVLHHASDHDDVHPIHRPNFYEKILVTNVIQNPYYVYSHHVDKYTNSSRHAHLFSRMFLEKNTRSRWYRLECNLPVLH